jgi:mRNA-degrading endonuclease RelE of RelBE toxin-antitoxin system
MRVLFSKRFSSSFQEAPDRVQREFGKQLGYLLRNLHHPSLHAKKYDETRGIWQARVDGGWRFYFTIEGDLYNLIDIIPHPK